MKKWIVQWSANMCGTDEYRATLANTEEEAIELYISEAHDHVEGMQEMYSDNEDDEGEFAYDPSELDIWAEEYNAEKHDALSTGGAWEFN